MTQHHKPLKFPANREKFLEKAFMADDGCIGVGGEIECGISEGEVW